MNGDAGVTKRMRFNPPVRPTLVIAAFVTLVTTFNIFTQIHDAAEHGQALPFWEPATWEYTSGLATLFSCPIIYWAIQIAPAAPKGWLKIGAVHAAGSLAFSCLHILVMNAIRVAIYAAAGRHYHFAGAGFWYEYRKDLVAYLIWAVVFWYFTDEAGHPSAWNGPRLIDIRDGKRLLRVPLEEIAAIRAAGNYVEFILADERRPLARQSLSAALRQLGDDFLRTHRSWAINLKHVRVLRPVGSGDHEVELAGGLKVPVSRRFHEAVTRLRAPPLAP